MVDIASVARVTSLLSMATRDPSIAHFLAAASPIPLLAPVTTIIFPANLGERGVLFPERFGMVSPKVLAMTNQRSTRGFPSGDDEEPWKAFDIVVVGAGSAGMSAAIAAARLGRTVLLVERYGFAGGISTQVLDTFYGFYTPGEASRRVVGGIGWEVASALIGQGDALERPSSYGAGTGVTYDPDALKILWEQTALHAGVNVLYHVLCIDSVIDGDGAIRGIEVQTRAGTKRISASVVIDASGDADVAALAGVPFEHAGDAGESQALTTTFKMINVDTERARLVRQPEIQALMADAIEDGAYDLPRREGSVHITPMDGVMATNMTRVSGIDPTNPEGLSWAEIEGRRQAAEYARFLRDRVPGYENARMSGLSHQIGVREARRIFGEYRLDRNDVLEARQFDDAIAQCGAPIEAHHAADTRWEYVPESQTYGIPYRCLVPLEVDGMIVAGRCLSATFDAHASVRSMGQCMAMGQAAGTAAAIAVSQGSAPRAVNISTLRATLRDNGAIVDRDVE